MDDEETRMYISQTGRVGIGTKSPFFQIRCFRTFKPASAELTGTLTASTIDVGSIDLSGTLTAATVDLNAGNIDGVAIGEASQSTAKFTNVTASSLESLLH